MAANRSRDMIAELNSVLVSNEELARIEEFRTALRDMQQRRAEERQTTLASIQRMYGFMGSLTLQNWMMQYKSSERARLVPPQIGEAWKNTCL